MTRPPVQLRRDDMGRVDFQNHARGYFIRGLQTVAPGQHRPFYPFFRGQEAQGGLARDLVILFSAHHLVIEGRGLAGPGPGALGQQDHQQ